MSCDFGSLCGFSVHFYTVSPCIGQVTHAFLTRPPLSPQSPHRSALTPSSARLACVKRAASVHPEPGSNSLVCSFSFSPLPLSRFPRITVSLSSSFEVLDFGFPFLRLSLGRLRTLFPFPRLRCYTVRFSTSSPSASPSLSDRSASGFSAPFLKRVYYITTFPDECQQHFAFFYYFLCMC